MENELKLSDYLRSALGVLESLRERLIQHHIPEQQTVMHELTEAELCIRRVLHLVDGT